jgi:hypothetical protein
MVFESVKEVPEFGNDMSQHSCGVPFSSFPPNCKWRLSLARGVSATSREESDTATYKCCLRRTTTNATIMRKTTPRIRRKCKGRVLAFTQVIKCVFLTVLLKRRGLFEQVWRLLFNYSYEFALARSSCSHYQYRQEWWGLRIKRLGYLDAIRLVWRHMIFIITGKE